MLLEPGWLGQEPLQTAGGCAGSSCASSRLVLEVLLSTRKRWALLSCSLPRQGMVPELSFSPSQAWEHREVVESCSEEGGTDSPGCGRKERGEAVELGCSDRGVK